MESCPHFTVSLSPCLLLYKFYMFSLYQGGGTVGREESQGCVKSILVQVTRNRYFLLHNRKSRLNEKNILCNVCTCIIFINSKYISHLYVCVLYFFFHLLMQLIYVRSLSYMIEHTFNLQFPSENTIIFFSNAVGVQL